LHGRSDEASQVQTAKWLSTEEKELATERLKHEGSKGHGASLTWSEAKVTLLEWRLWIHYIVSSILR